MKFLNQFKRPVLWLGHGVRLAGAVNLLPDLLNHWQVPTILSWSGADMISSYHPFVFGRAGVYGQRCANRIIEEADGILAIGTRLSLLQIGYDISKIKAKLAVCDIDEVESRKWKPEIQFPMDAKDFILKCMNDEPIRAYQGISGWVNQCRAWKSTYPWVESAHDDGDFYNSYRFMETLNKYLKPDQMIVTDVAGPNICAHQVLKLKPPQRLITSQGLGEMGVGLPFAIGASFARGKGEVLCLHTDGAMMMNLQELQTIAHHRLPIKLIIFSNDGYGMIKHTQKVLYDGRRTSVDNESGVSCAPFGSLVPHFGPNRLGADEPVIPIRLLKKQKGITPPLAASLNMPVDADDAIQWLMKEEGPACLEVVMDPEQLYVPRLQAIKNKDGTVSSPRLSDLYPPLVEWETRWACA
jgi:acetolactate synthase-1/2/3 large subunit